MGAYGKTTAKPTELSSHSSCVLNLQRSRPARGQWDSLQGMNHLSPHADGRQLLSGAQGLGSSQTYTPEFGRAVYQAWTIGRTDTSPFTMLELDADSDDEVDWDEWRRAAASSPNWAAARLDEVVEFANLSEDRPMFQVIGQLYS